MRTHSGREVCAIPGSMASSRFVRKAATSMQKVIPGSTVTVPVPDHKEMRIGTLMSIIRQSGLDKSLFA